MSRHLINLQQLFTTQQQEKACKKGFQCHDILAKGNIAKAKSAALLALKKAQQKMPDDEKKGYLVTVQDKGGTTIGYGLPGQVVDQSWCETQSALSDNYTVYVTPRSETTSSADKEEKKKEKMAEV